MISWGALGRVGTASRHSCPSCIHFGCQVTATRASAIRASAFQPSAIGFGIPAPELQAPLTLPSQSGQLANYSTNQLMLHSQVSGLGHRVPGSGVRVQVQVRVFGFRCRYGG
jgi:hypothetical protein